MRIREITVVKKIKLKARPVGVGIKKLECFSSIVIETGEASCKIRDMKKLFHLLSFRVSPFIGPK